jgi:hypothetical protein
MPFNKQVRQSVLRRANFRCCFCQSTYIEAHHIIPQADGGPDTEDNAAPLCPNHHEMWGANPTKRNFIREVRDYWYEQCEQAAYTPEERRLLEEVRDIVQHAATKDDLKALVRIVQESIQANIDQPSVGFEDARGAVARVAGASLVSTYR